MVQRLAAHAEKSDPALIEEASVFYCDHPALVKTHGGAAFSTAMANMAEKHLS